MARRTGADMALSIGGTAVPAMRTAAFDHTGTEIDTTAAGDVWMNREFLRNDYTLEWSALLNIAATYIVPGNQVGTSAAWILKTYSTEAAGIVGSTGLITRFHIDSAYNDVVALSGTILCNGTAAVYDLVHGS